MNPIAIRTEKNPFNRQFVPIGFFRPIKRLGKMYGYGVIEPILKVLETEEDSFNILLQALWMDVSRPMEYVPDNILDEDSLGYEGGGLIPVRKLGESVAVLPTPVPNFNGSSFVLNYLEKTKQNVTAITDYQTGANQIAKSQTATEVNTKTFLSEQRTNKILQNFETEVIEPAGKMALWLTQQYLADDKESIYRVIGKKGKMMERKIKFKDIDAVKDVVVVAGSSAYTNRADKINKWMALYQLALSEAKMGQLAIPIDREYILSKLLDEGYGVKDPDNYIPSLKEREEETIKKKIADLNQAKQENLDPMTARVMPDDDAKVHITIHQTALRNRGMTDEKGQFLPYSPEQTQMLTEHINQHTTQTHRYTLN
jgi:hypothetical protein